MSTDKAKSSENTGAIEPQSNPTSASAAAPTQSLDNDLVSILLVDDEPRNLTVLETVLADPNYRLVRAESAEQALLALVAEEFALLVLDIQMPGMSGFELAQLIKQRKKTAGVPIIFLTAYYSEDQHVLEGYDSGAVDYLHKPINPAILRSKVAVFAELHRRNRESVRANHTLQNEVLARRRAEEQLRELNDELERRVADRTMTLLRRERELQKLAEALTKADRRKDEFLATLAHELRNPLAPLQSGLDLLNLARDPDTVAETLSMMSRQLAHMVRLIDDLLNASRITNDKLTLRKERVSLPAIVATAVEASRPVIDSSRHALLVGLPDETLWLDADPTRLAQVVSNLLTNAAKYTPEGGRIELAAERAGSEAVVRVTDTGLGIPPEMLAEVFEMFTQVNRTLERSQGGLGIGLAIVKRLVELHGGTITAESAGHGEGSTFRVRLPLLEAYEQGKDHRAAREFTPAQSAISGRRVLVVDDNVDAAESLAKLLRICGHEIRIAHSGQEALIAAHPFKPEVVLLDIGLPGMNGYEVAKRLRAEPALRDAVLVAVTGWGNEDYKRKSREAGFDFHLTKPVEVTAIEGILARLERSGC
jgi:signal transduction histidine kinase